MPRPPRRRCAERRGDDRRRSCGGRPALGAARRRQRPARSFGTSRFALWALHGAVLAGRAGAGAPAPPAPPPAPTRRNSTAIRVDMLSERPWVCRFTNVLDARQSALVRQLVFDAVAFFNDTGADGGVRPGARALPPGDPRRPRYRMQNERHLSLYFSEPPPVLEALSARVAGLMRVPQSSLEAIFHLYAPGVLPANIHMDNFNKFLFPHRYASLSVFFDDAADGGTVFPLLQRPGGPDVAADRAQVEAWHRMINETRMRPGEDGYAYRRVDADEGDAFRRRTLEAAIAMCKGRRGAQEPVVPMRGSAYMWKNYLNNGEDDVRTIHAGCGSTTGFKVLGTLFVRDWPGPFQEHRSFWDVDDAPRDDKYDEMQRQLEVRMLHSFKVTYILSLYKQQQEVMRELLGDRGVKWLQARQYLHYKSLTSEQVHEEVLSSIGEMARQYAGADMSWSKVVPADQAF